MADYIGKIDINRLIGVKVADVDYGEIRKKCLVIPIEDNDITQWNEEMQLWFRAVRYREQKSRFSHFIMRFIPRSKIKKLSQSQIESMTSTHIGGLIDNKSITSQNKDNE